MLNAIGKPVDEAELVRRCKKADHKAQEELYASYSNRMFRVAFRYIKSQADTEDIMMVTFTKVFAGMSTYTHLGVGGLEAWIRRIVVNESLMWLRRRQPHKSGAGVLSHG